MRALIRNPGETVIESYNIPGIDWDTGTPLTDAEWSGGPYRLVDEVEFEIQENPVEQDTKSLPETCSDSEGAVTESPGTVTYGGKEYTLEELKKLIG